MAARLPLYISGVYEKIVDNKALYRAKKAYNINERKWEGGCDEESC
ncbi:MAG: hypothetical protein LBG43_03465 [Treponema sp.]|jgi:hypothetical protein|nr:hypothetical protein [Treponema sp.]